ncbi:hypothetical protein KXD93_28065 [Mucilaginibacter sp. BJC16-A38]|uniref:hypothetical protein n=1 Tax=Mucilaginibacter phenanthrenivorans TaxID=1234842 RepID=UPI00215751B6|nr:hypothetical protein [Mucilaginibacter phenanthrenivorans]MCR8561543.1 hypothetical protein [Mucilaginibacter phenanthrenivorans]
MKQTTKFLIAVMAAAITLGSCKKSSDPNASSTQSMKLTLNGKAVSYSACLISTAEAGSSKQTIITGTTLANGVPTGATFEVELFKDIALIKAGDVFPASTVFAQANSSALLYFPNDNDFFATQPGNPQGTVTITAVTSDIIKGTFSGKLFTQDDYEGKTVKYTATGGTFVASKSIGK